jgi:ribosome maturation factor RimP
MPSGQVATRRARLAAVLSPVVAESGYELEEVTVSRAGRREVVRVIVDSRDAGGGISLDAIAEVSRRVSEALDTSESAAGIGAAPYTLEVTSPGVDRPLTAPRHWRRSLGRLVSVRHTDRSLTGRVVAADSEQDGSVTLEVDGRREQLPYGELGPGRVQVEFNRPGSATGQEREER